MAYFTLQWALRRSMLVRTDELERGERSTLSLESMASSHTSRSPSVPRLLAVQECGYQALGQGIWPAAMALFLSVSTSILVFPFFPYVPSSGSFGDALPQVRPHHTSSEFYRCECCCLVFCMEQLATCGSTMQRCRHVFALIWEKASAQGCCFARTAALTLCEHFCVAKRQLRPDLLTLTAALSHALTSILGAGSFE